MMKFRFKKSLILATTVIVPTATLVSCGSNFEYSKNHLLPRTELNEYGSWAISSSNRRFDVNYSEGNVVGNSYQDAARILPLVRNYSWGEEKYEKEGEGDNLKIKEVSKLKEGIKPEGAKKVEASADGATWTELQFSTDGRITTDMSNFKKYRFTMADTEWQNSKGISTKKKLIARDYFYGWVRGLLASKTTRTSGEISSTQSLPELKFDKNWTSNLVDQSINNQNGYLYDLLSIDVKQTFEDGKKLGDQDNKFTISLKKPSNNFIATALASSSMFAPAPSSFIIEKAKEDKYKDIKDKPWIKYGISNYGDDLAELRHVAPYYWSKFDEGKELVLEKNIHFHDKAWAEAKNRITKYTYHITQKQDPKAAIIQRRQGYEEGSETILDASVLNSKPDYEDILSKDEKYGVRLSKVVKVGLQQKLYWNPLPKDGVMSKYNDKGKELMYGFSNKQDIENNPEALNNFFNGDAATLRHAIDLAYNWYAGVQLVKNDKTKMSLLSPIAPEQIISKKGNTKTIADIIMEDSKTKSPDSIYIRPEGVPSLKDLKQSYDTNTNNIQEASKSPAFDEAKKLLAKKFDGKYNGAIIPIETWNDQTKNVANAMMRNQFKTMLQVLNLMGKEEGISFVGYTPNDWNVHLMNFQNHRSQFQFFGWNNDYEAAASSLQGATKIGNTGISLGQYLNTEFNKKMISCLSLGSGESDFLFKIAPTLTINDLHTMQTNAQELNSDKVKAFKILEKITANNYFEQQDNEDYIKEVVGYIQNSGLSYKFIINNNSILASDRSNGAYSRVVMKTWMHKRIQKDGKLFLQDMSVD